MTLSWYVGVDWGINLIGNGTFATAGAGGADVFGSWSEATSGSSTVVDETTIVHRGAHACKLTTDAGAVAAYVYQSISVVPGSFYSFSFWTRGDGTNAGLYQLIDPAVFGGSPIIPITSTGVTGTSWKQVRKEIWVHPGCTSIQLYLISPTAASGIAYFDDVVISTYTPEQTYVTDVDISRGRASVFDAMKPGKARITLENESARFDPWNVSGPLYGYVYPGKKIYICVTDGSGAELVANGDMEAGSPPSSWIGSSATLTSVATSTPVDPSNGKCLRIIPSSDAGYAYQGLNVEAGRWYRLTLRGRSSSSGHAARVRIRDTVNSADIYTGEYKGWGLWEPLRVDFRTPQGCTGIRVIMQVETSGDTVYFDDVSVKDLSVPLFHGMVTDIRPTGRLGARSIVIDAIDGLAQLEAKSVYADYRASSTADVCIDDILDDVGWLGGDWRDLDTGDVTVRNFWGGGSALDAINQLVDAEHGAFFISADGAARFMDRTTYIGTTAVGALDEDDIVDIMPTMPWDHIRNEIIVKGNIVKAWATTQECAGNGDMEIGSPPGAWTASDATLTRYTASVHGGSAALSVAVTSNGGYAYQQLSVSAGESVTFSGWMRSSAAGHRCRYRVRDVTNSTDIYDSGYTDNTSWNQKTNTFTVPAGCRVIRVICQVETNGETAYFDDVSVTAVGREIWNYEEKPTLAAGETITLWAEYQDENGKWCPAKNVRDAAAYIDYTANTAEDGTGTDMTGSLSVTTREYSTTSKLIVSNTHASTTLYITMLRLRGASLRLVPIQVKAEDVTSQETYGKRSHVVDTPFLQTQAAAKTLATALETYYDDPINAPTVRMQHRFPVAVGFDLLENIAFTAPTYSLNETKRIGLIHHWTETSMNDLWTEWTFEPVPS